MLALFGLILLEPDFGTSMSLLLIAAVMVFAAGLNYRYIVGAVLCALPPIALLVMGTAYRRQRVLTFLDPWHDPLGAGFQIIQSLIAVGTGGVWGRGLMNGVQKLFFLPGAAHRLHLLGDFRGARAHRRHRGAALLLRHHVARRCASRCARPTRSARFSRSA